MCCGKRHKRADKADSKAKATDQDHGLPKVVMWLTADSIRVVARDL
jgi:hypothetical protein